MQNTAAVDVMDGIERGLRMELASCGEWLYRLGYTPGTAGNLSVRLGHNRVLVTPTGISKCLLQAEDMTLVDLDGAQLSCGRRATSELGMHLAVYRARPDVQAVVHAHPPTATALACTGRGLDEMLCQEAAMTLGCVPLASYATTGTCEVAASLAPYLASHDAILLASHGAVTYGCNPQDALMKMETLEHLALVHLRAQQFGGAQVLCPERVERLRGAKHRYLAGMD